MMIYPTYTSDTWVKDTVIIGGIRQYYAGALECMRQLNLAHYPYEVNNATRIKPYENTPHVQK